MIIKHIFDIKEMRELKSLALLRKQQGLTQKELAQKIGVESNTVWKWEKGIITPSVETVQKLAEFLNVSMDELLNGPKKNELRINFIWEVEDMDLLKIESNEFTACWYWGLYCFRQRNQGALQC